MSIKGKLFEFFVFRILVSCGFKMVVPDGLLVYHGSAGLMVQGLGQPHNADVLVSPPMQTPFYYPTRLLVECKCYARPIGMPIIRNVLGLRDDINNFDIITEEILKNRRNNCETMAKYYPMKRYMYQVAVASIDGFCSTAVAFAQTHRIPLISFSCSPLFSKIRACIDKVDDIAQCDHEYADQICDYIKAEMRNAHNGVYPYGDEQALEAFINEIQNLEKKMDIGLLNDGTILFLVETECGKDITCNDKIYNDGFSIHWSTGSENTWVLRNDKRAYCFELPKEIYDHWIEMEGEQVRNALCIKQSYFSEIVVFSTRHAGRRPIQIIKLSQTFIEEAQKKV